MKIVFFGDSITDMGRYREEEKHDTFKYGAGYPYVLASKLYSENPHEYEIINRGISGNRVVDLYARIKSDVWNLKPDVLSILIGTNDVWHQIHYQNGVELDRYENIYRMMILETQKKFPNIKIILCEPFFLKGCNTELVYKEFEQLYEYAKVVKKLAEELHLPFVPLQEKFTELGKKYEDTYYLYDGVHPTLAGSKLIADEWLKVFETI
ncbi:MAG: SGNH/GDSL hydrolase family protein [Clostridia bacterium]|nr:SGNH/GDSL hydrolase family protein [Clostridia bacterium]